jgi:hypothetical protein
MSKGVLRLAVAAVIAVMHVRQAASAELVYRVTIRDFLPAMCAGSNAALTEKWNQTWGNTVEQTDWRVNRVLNATYASFCPFPELIASGELLPNFDFQAENYQAGFPENVGRGKYALGLFLVFVLHDMCSHMGI